LIDEGWTIQFKLDEFANQSEAEADVAVDKVPTARMVVTPETWVAKTQAEPDAVVAVAAYDTSRGEFEPIAVAAATPPARAPAVTPSISAAFNCTGSAAKVREDKANRGTATSILTSFDFISFLQS
jgi:hypothetical protein